MAQKVNIELVSDLDGKTAEQTVTFGLDGVEYEIDLSDAQAEKLRDALAKYVKVARRVKGSKPRKAASRGDGPSPREVREWANANGFEVPARGRVPEAVTEAYKAAHA